MSNHDITLTLRKFEVGDIQQIVEILNNPRVSQYLSSRIPQPYTCEDAGWWVETGSQSGVIRALEVNGSLAGCVGIEPGQHEYARTGEVGYWLAEAHWQKGLATEALTRLIADLPSHAFARLQATVFQGNHASCNVLEKCGFIKEAELEKALYKQNRYYNAVIYALVL